MHKTNPILAYPLIAAAALSSACNSTPERTVWTPGSEPRKNNQTYNLNQEDGASKRTTQKELHETKEASTKNKETEDAKMRRIFDEEYQKANQIIFNSDLKKITGIAFSERSQAEKHKLIKEILISRAVKVGLTVFDTREGFDTSKVDDYYLTKMVGILLDDGHISQAIADEVKGVIADTRNKMLGAIDKAAKQQSSKLDKSILDNAKLPNKSTLKINFVVLS